MTIQRKYSLPNCTLILEGLGDHATGNGQADMRPVLSMLINAECHFATNDATLAGGRDFFESLVTAVNAYAQEFLSKVPHAETHKQGSGLVQLQKVDGNRHRLIVHSDGRGPESKSGELSQPTQMDLTTVQLFDLVEAVDQFFADSQTLPDLSLELKPSAKRRGGSAGKMAEQSVPAAVGVTGLALAAVASFLVPIPPVQRPPQPKPQQNTSTAPTQSASNQLAASPTPPVSPTASTSPTASASPTPPASSPTDLEATLNTASEITDPSQLYNLNRKLRDQIDQAWKTRSRLSHDLVYRVSVAADGAILGYKPIGSAASRFVEQTPLPKLVYNPAAASNAANHEPMAPFKVVFTAKGVPQVSPWQGYRRPPAKSLGAQITDSRQLGDLKQKVYNQLRQNWSSKPTFPQDLTYRVATNKDGAIADYEPINQPAYDYLKETPLPKLVQPSSTSDRGAAKTQEPLAQFRVTFKPSGVLEIGQWQ